MCNPLPCSRDAQHKFFISRYTYKLFISWKAWGKYIWKYVLKQSNFWNFVKVQVHMYLASCLYYDVIYQDTHTQAWGLKLLLCNTWDCHIRCKFQWAKYAQIFQFPAKLQTFHTEIYLNTCRVFIQWTDSKLSILNTCDTPLPLKMHPSKLTCVWTSIRCLKVFIVKSVCQLFMRA